MHKWSMRAGCLFGENALKSLLMIKRHYEFQWADFPPLTRSTQTATTKILHAKFAHAYFIEILEIAH